MINRKTLKMRAKEVLRDNYVLALFVGIVLILTSGALTGTGSSGGRTTFSSSDLTSVESLGQMVRSGNFDHMFTSGGQNMASNSGLIPNLLLNIFGLAFGVVALILILIKFTVGNTLTVGGYKYFLDTAQNIPSGFQSVFYGFYEGRFKNIFITMLLRDLYTFLWTLLFIIPGIIKSYSYRMVPYILAENPEMHHSDVIRASSNMMDGRKWELFVLDFSFFFWLLGSALIPFVGSALLVPYLHATDAQFFLAITGRGPDYSMIEFEARA